MSENTAPPSFTRTEITAPHRPVRSLVWRGDELVDWVVGGRAFLPDGTTRERHVAYSYRFDAAVGSPSGNYAVIHERLGTKGLLLREGTIVRELDRSFYHANVYEYPVCLFALPGGREVIAHCPDSYCDAVIEDAETGERLSAPSTGDRQSFFHSRLAASPDGRFLLTAGWVWQPWDVVLVWELRTRPDGLIEFHEPDRGYQDETEVASAAFAGNDHLLVSTASGADNFVSDEELTADQLSPMSLGRWSLAENRWVSHATAADEVGTLMPVGERHAVGFYDCPKLFDLASGRVVHRWPELRTGRQLSSIIHHLKPEDRPPPIALDPLNRRFAVGIGQQVTVIQFSE
jgi:hypothetical protein